MKNNYRIDEEKQLVYIEAYTSKKEYCEIIIDLDKLEQVKLGSNWTISTSKNGKHKYAVSDYMVNGKKKKVRLHRIVTDCPQHLVVDHLDGNTLNNTLINLRPGTRQANSQNSSVRSDNKSGYRGVLIERGWYVPTIHLNGKKKRLGKFKDLFEAIEVRQAAEKQYYKYIHINAIINSVKLSIFFDEIRLI